jgi:hypothetical protein
VKRKKEIGISLAVIPQAAKIQATVYGKCLVQMEKAVSNRVQ